MDLSAVDALRAAVADAPAVVAVGGRSHSEIGGAVVGAVEVSAPAGVQRYEAEDLTVTVGAGTPCAELDAVLRERGQECPLDPPEPGATVGGVLACGLSGLRRLRHGPLRDHLLEVRFVTADGRIVKGGGPTVKNVTGYDLPRLMVGSLGTLGVLVQVTLRCRPRPAAARWFATETPPARLDRLYRPSAVLWDGATTHVLLEGDARDIEEQAIGMREVPPPPLPAGAYRGRISVAPGSLPALARALRDGADLRWRAELGVGTVHVASDEPGPLRAARDAAHAEGGWLLREQGADVEPFGRPLPNVALLQRIKAAFDPDGKLAPGRLPL